MIQKQIQEEMKQAMLSRDSVRLTTLRGLLAAFTNELVSLKRKPTEELGDEDALNVIRRGVKQRKDSIEQFTKGGRDDLAKNEEAELKILETYLPQQMSAEEVRPIAEAKKAELGITDKSKAGQLTGMVMKELKNRADGTVVKQVVDSLFD